MDADKTLVITGTSSGLGLAAAVAAARDGWHTVATMRDPTRDGPLRKAAATAGVEDRIQVARLDVNDHGSVDACIAGIVADRGRLDAVVNNAGSGHVGTIAALVSVVVAWFAIRFTGRYPRALFDFVVGVGRWALRVSAYAFLLTTDRYPPFSLTP